MSKKNYSIPVPGRSLEQDFGITSANAALLKDPVLVGSHVEAIYTGVDAISTKYDGLPIYSIIWDMQAYTVRVHFNATTGWKTVALT